MLESIINFDYSILDGIQSSLRCAFLDAVMPVITQFGAGGIFWIACALLLAIFKKTRKTGLMMGTALLIGLIVCNITMKPLIARPRPFDLRPIDFELLVKRPSDFSFPSGHTIASFECASVLMIRDRRFGIPALVLAVLVAFSRLYLYVHYPTDVFTGIVLGVTFGILGVLIINAVWKKFEAKKA